MIKRSAPDIEGLHADLLRENFLSAMVGVGNVFVTSGLVNFAGGDMATQLAGIRRQLGELLATEGMTFANVVATTTYTTDMKALMENGHVLFSAFRDGHPTSSYIGIKELAMPELLVEVVVTAAKE